MKFIVEPQRLIAPGVSTTGWGDPCLPNYGSCEWLCITQCATKAYGCGCRTEAGDVPSGNPNIYDTL